MAKLVLRCDETVAVHAGSLPDPLTGAVVPPIVHASTFRQASPGVHQGYDYTRGGNPTRTAYEKALAALERGKWASSFSSGLAAIAAVLHTFDRPARVLACDDLYGGTKRLFTKVWAQQGWTFDFQDLSNLENFQFAKDYDLVWIETPTNPLLKVIDIGALAKLCRQRSILLVVDNTLASPICQKPLELGADAVVHSTTKYIGGHTDLLGGAVMTSSEELGQRLAFVQMAVGAVPSPADCALAHRSLKTLPLRMERHCFNALEVAKRLQGHPKITSVYYPGLTSHLGHGVAASQMQGFSGVVSFEVKGTLDDVKKFLSGLELVTLAESLGGVETLVNHPGLMTHASLSSKDRELMGINDQLLRLSVGIENVEDIVADLMSALEGV